MIINTTNINVYQPVNSLVDIHQTKGAVSHSELAIKPILPEHLDVNPSKLKFIQDRTRHICNKELRQYIIQQDYRHIIYQIRGSIVSLLT